jgi:hypothetical protein
VYLSIILKKNGKLYLLTAAHNLPTTENEELEIDLSRINNILKRYYFHFFYQRNQCYDAIDKTEERNSYQDPLVLKGAKLLSVYFDHEHGDLISGSNGLIKPDLALLELLQTPNSIDQRLYFAGWNSNSNGGLRDSQSTTYSPFQDGVIISHPLGYPKKSALPILPKKRVISYEVDVNGSITYEIPLHNPSTIDSDTQWVFQDHLIPQIFITDLERGSSGAGSFNSNLKLYAIYNGGVDGQQYVNYSTALDAVWNTDEYFYEPLKESLFRKPLKDFLAPDIDIKDLDGCYPCANSVDGLPLQEEQGIRRLITIDEPITEDFHGTIVARDQIIVNNDIESGANVEIGAGDEVVFNTGAEIKAGAEVTVELGRKLGLGCATGCYTIENKGTYTIEGGTVYGHVINANTVETIIAIPGQGEVTTGEKEVNSDMPRLFDIGISGIDTPGIYDVIATYKNGCDELVVNYEVQITQEAIGSSKSDYFAYANEFFNIDGYIFSKTVFANQYVTNPGYIPSNSSNLPEDISFKVKVAKDIPYAKAQGFSWSFRDHADYGSLALTSSEFEVQEKLSLDILQDGILKMDVYYPEVKPDVSLKDLNELPLIIYAFGGSFVKNDDGKLGEITCKWLASKGYVVAAIDYRLGMDTGDGELAKRAVVRAWQDMEAAVKYWRVKSFSSVILDAERSIWKINPDKIYGLGWSAGGITVLNNLYLSRSKYVSERASDGYLRSTTSRYSFVEYSDPESGISETWTTYDLENYPTVPCLGGGGSPCNPTSTELSQLDGISGKLNKGTSFAGALGKKEWMLNAGNSEVLDIHHLNDGIVPFQEGTPFGYIGSLINLAHPFFGGGPSLAKVYGGGALKTYASLNAVTGFSLLALAKSNQAGGWNIKGGRHRPHLKFGDRWAKVKNDPKIEPKIMFAVDAFFSKQGNLDTERMVNNETKLGTELTETEVDIDFKLYPNPSDGTFYLNFTLNQSSSVSFKITNLNGQVVFEQNNQQFNKGNHDYTFKMANKLSMAVYILKVSAGDFSEVTKLIIE